MTKMHPAAEEPVAAGLDAIEPDLHLTGVLDPAAPEPTDLEWSESGSLTTKDRRGMVSAEWAVGIIAAIAIAGVLVAVVTNGAVQDALLKFILGLIKSFADYMPR